jgi:hypothetical protein
MTAAVSAVQGDLSRVIELKQIYSSPPQEEDPSKYPQIQRLPSASNQNKRNPAKITQ